jgi:sulfur-carrier protein
VQVRFYANLRQTVGASVVDVLSTEAMTVRDLLGMLVADYPDLGPELLSPGGELWPHVHVFINGRDAPRLANGLATRLAADDAVQIFPPTAGG